MTGLLQLSRLTKLFPVRGGILRRITDYVHAVEDVSLEIGASETLGLIGESGSGKSTLGRLAIHLIAPTSGTVTFDGTDLTSVSPSTLRRRRRGMQMVFQDPYSSLDPHVPVSDSLVEPLIAHLNMSAPERRERVSEVLQLVGLPLHRATAYPAQLSGGQLQRISIARALMLSPRLIVLDEPVSALDVSTQADILNLLEALQDELGIAYLHIGHNPALVAHASRRMAVMYLGKVVEIGPAREVYTRPKHPYTEALLSAIPVADPNRQRVRRRIILSGEMPSPMAPPAGCPFQTRCPHVMDICRRVEPTPFVTLDGTSVKCHLHEEGPRLQGESVSVLRRS